MCVQIEHPKNTIVMSRLGTALHKPLLLVHFLNTTPCFLLQLGDVQNPSACYTMMQGHLEKIELEVGESAASNITCFFP